MAHAEQPQPFAKGHKNNVLGTPRNFVSVSLTESSQVGHLLRKVPRNK